jgi:hypothetical protein
VIRRTIVALGLMSCGDPAAQQATTGGSASARAALAPQGIDESVVPPRRPTPSNPLGLPAATPTLPKGQRVYVVPERMLASAKIGNSLELCAATVEGMDGHDVIVRIGHDAAFSIHAGYLVIPRQGRVQRGSRVIASYRERLRHAVVQRVVGKKVAVRFSDAAAYLGDQLLEADDLGVLGEGLEPGAYALEPHARGFRHVLLVSSAIHVDGTKRWLVLGAAGEARLLAEKDLSLVPTASRSKPGSAVLVAWRGEMVPGVLRSAETTGLYTVKRPRLGPLLVVGPDMVMPAPAGKEKE